MTDALNDAALDQLFRSARTYNAFTGEVSDETLQQLYGLLKLSLIHISEPTRPY